MNELYRDYLHLGLVRNGHFLLSSGRHSGVYIDKDAIYRSSIFNETIQRLGDLCFQFLVEPTREVVIIGPAIAGAVLAAPVWYRLSNMIRRSTITFAYPEKINGEMTFRRGYDQHLKGKDIILVEDVIETGASVTSTANAVASCGGKVIGCVCIWNRTFWCHDDFPVYPLISKHVESYPKDNCLLCIARIPLTDPKSAKPK